MTPEEAVRAQQEENALLNFLGAALQLYGAHMAVGNPDLAEKEREVAHIRLDAYLDRRAANITKART